MKKFLTTLPAAALGMICLAGPFKRFMRAKAKAEPKD